MPFLEINDFGSDAGTRSLVTAEATQVLIDVYGVDADIVSLYFIAFGEQSYGHAGKLPAAAENRRIFAKLHAYPRPLLLRQELAKRLTTALSHTYRLPPAKVAIYFFDRHPENVAHGGILKINA